MCARGVCGRGVGGRRGSGSAARVVMPERRAGRGACRSVLLRARWPLSQAKRCRGGGLGHGGPVGGGVGVGWWPVAELRLAEAAARGVVR